MGNIMAGMAVALIGVTLFFTADLFSRYPSRIDGKPAYAFFWMRAASYIFFAVGVVIMLTGFR